MSAIAPRTTAVSGLRLQLAEQPAEPVQPGDLPLGQIDPPHQIVIVDGVVGMDELGHPAAAGAHDRDRVGYRVGGDRIHGADLPLRRVTVALILSKTGCCRSVKDPSQPAIEGRNSHSKRFR